VFGHRRGGGILVLDNLVLGSGRATADDSSVAVFLEGEGVFADSRPPDVLDGALALAWKIVSKLRSYVRVSR
jgi:hypothetical protein